MLTIGQPVVVSGDDGLQIGEVVGAWAAPTEPLYDVSLLSIVRKAVPQSALRPALASELDELMSAFLMPRVPVASERDAHLQKQYALFLARARAELGHGQRERAASASAAFGIGDKIELREGNARLLGAVVGITMRDALVHYVVDVMGEQRCVSESQVARLDAHASGLALGARVRFVAQGHEDDEDFLGVVCSCRSTERGDAFAIMFDDGDVMEDLSSNDLVLVARA